MRLLKNGQIISGQNKVRGKGKSKTKKLKSEIIMRNRKLKFLKNYRNLLTQYYYLVRTLKIYIFFIYYHKTILSQKF